jgi:protein required for attachment to host cells
MKTAWILVANASKGLCFERSDGVADLKLLAEFVDPLGRSKGSDLASDRSGYESTGRGHGSAAFTPRTDSRTKEHDSFARRLAGYLNDGIAAHRCDTLAILASNPFLGEVKTHLDSQSTKALASAVAKDLTSFAGDELRRRIDQALIPSG